jgi:hypothetical protein
MVDKEQQEELKDWNKNLNKMKKNLTNFADGFLKEFSDEEKALIDEKLKEHDSSEFSKGLDDIINKLNAEFDKIK